MIFIIDFFFNEEDEVFLKFYYKYILFKNFNFKFINLKVDLFKILKKIDNLTYKIDIFAH